MVDGLFIESCEWIVGFDVIDVDDFDVVIEIVVVYLMVWFGLVEVCFVWLFGLMM